MGRVFAVALALAGLVGAASGCFLPRGTPVVLDRRAARTYDGDAVLVEVSPDGTRCRVATRGPSLVVERHWVDCRYVHESFGPR